MGYSSSYNVFAFLLSIVIYHFLGNQNKLTIDIVSDTSSEKYGNYKKSHNSTMLIFLAVTLVFQIFANFINIKNLCGNNAKDTIGYAFIATVVPWVFIFGVLVTILIVTPGIKSAFSNIIGYAFVSSEANHVLTELLIPTSDINQQIDDAPAKSRRELESAAELIIKICGNTSMLINQIVPENFSDFWSGIQPLLKSKYKGIELSSVVVGADGEVDPAYKNVHDLFKLAYRRDYIGELCWYIYTGILVISIVQMKIVTKGCNKSLETMEKNYQSYVKTQDKLDKEKEIAEGTTYTITR